MENSSEHLENQRGNGPPPPPGPGPSLLPMPTFQLPKALETDQEIAEAIDDLEFLTQQKFFSKPSILEDGNIYHYQIQNFSADMAASGFGTSHGLATHQGGLGSFIARGVAGIVATGVQHGLIPALDYQSTKKEYDKFIEQYRQHPTLSNRFEDPHVTQSATHYSLLEAVSSSHAIDPDLHARALAIVSKGFVVGLKDLMSNNKSLASTLGGGANNQQYAIQTDPRFNQCNQLLTSLQGLKQQAHKIDDNIYSDALDWTTTAISKSLLTHRKDENVKKYIDEVYLPTLREIDPDRAADFVTRKESLDAWDRIKESNVPKSRIERAATKAAIKLGLTSHANPAVTRGL